MKKHLLLVLFTFFIAFFVLSLKNVSYAWSWSDYQEFCMNCVNTDCNSDTKWLANKIYTSKTTIQSIVENARL